MTRRIMRMRDFVVELTVSADDFVRPPRESQRNWLLKRALREFSDDLQTLDQLGKRFVPGGERQRPDDLATVDLDDAQIMEDWQLPLMEAMAEIVARKGGDVLEVGFGRGVSASLIQKRGVRSHTVIECNPFIIDRFERWRQTHPHRDIRVVSGIWQDVIEELGQFDAVFFHTYALDEEESVELLSQSVTFAAPFFPHAAAHLRPGGVFTYLSNEIDSLSRTHQRELLRYFDSLTMRVVPLQMPTDVQDAWWADSMVVVEATARGQ